jgi:tetratricopeptide (TPR) repeat protein
MEKPAGAKSKKQASKGPVVQKVTAPDPFSPQNIKQLGLRLGLPLLAVWVVGGCVAGVTQSSTAFWIALGIPAVITVGIAGLVVWVVGQARKAKSVAGLLQNVETSEGRKVALEKLDAGFKKNDPAAVFARAQLMLQEGDTKKALETLEQIDLGRVMAPIADEARAQRAMIHLLIGEVTPARDLVDAIDLSRQQDPKARAMMGSVVAEAWARTGQAKKAADTIALFNPEDADFEQVAPQIHRARAFVYAATGDVKAMRRALKKLLEQDARLLGSFLGKRTHPLLQKEAKQMLQASGQVPRKMQVQRH